MGFFDFLSSKKRVLGVDIGTAGVKIVELEKNENRFKLVNYGLSEMPEGGVNGLKFSEWPAAKTAEVIKRVLEKMETKNRLAMVSLPIALSFSVLIEMPLLPESEWPTAIPEEAKKYIPVPIKEVALDWMIVGQSQAKPKDPMIKQDNRSETKRMWVVLVAVPNEVIEKYKEIIRLAGLRLKAFEIESFSMARALILNDPKSYLILDFGTQSTNAIIVENGSVLAANTIESVKKDGVLPELERVVNLHKTRYNKVITGWVMTGGSVYPPEGAREKKEKEFAPLVKSGLGLETSFGNPLSRLEYPETLEDILKELAPALSVAVGMGMRE